jgi:hypothetical protein
MKERQPNQATQSNTSPPRQPINSPAQLTPSLYFHAREEIAVFVYPRKLLVVTVPSLSRAAKRATDIIDAYKYPSTAA